MACLKNRNGEGGLSQSCDVLVQNRTKAAGWEGVGGGRGGTWTYIIGAVRTFMREGVYDPQNPPLGHANALYLLSTFGQKYLGSSKQRLNILVVTGNFC